MKRKTKMRLWYYKRQILDLIGCCPMFLSEDVRDVLRKNRQASNKLGKILDKCQPVFSLDMKS